MNMKRRVKMRRGFMCQSPGSAAGCTAGDTLSVIVPRRPDRTLVDRANSLALNNSTSAKYARGFMCQSPGSAAGCTTGDPLSVIVPWRPDRTLVDRANSLALNNSTIAKYARGFMCQSPGSAAGCTTGDPLSVIVPRRPDRTLVDRANSLVLDDSTSAKYARLVESTPQRLGNNAAAKMKSTDSVPMPPVVKRRPGGDHKNTGVVGDRKALQKPAPAVASSADQVFQVVVMRVSLHCQGCAGKVKKHISKMEGVTSFSIDLESKRVTVMGHVSPVGVLESISKVKRAEFWPC